MPVSRLARWSRRETLGMGLIASTGLLGLGSALYRSAERGPAQRSFSLGTLRSINSRMRRDDQFAYPDIRATLVRYEPNEATRSTYVESLPGYLLVLWKCPHLGCRVMFCDSSQWFECPCHGARFSGLGEYRFGPPPRGLDRYATRLGGRDELLADTRRPILGPPRGTDTQHRGPAGPHCVG